MKITPSEAYEDYAKRHGVAVTELSDEQKSMAIMDAILNGNHVVDYLKGSTEQDDVMMTVWISSRDDNGNTCTA